MSRRPIRFSCQEREIQNRDLFANLEIRFLSNDLGLVVALSQTGRNPSFKRRPFNEVVTQNNDERPDQQVRAATNTPFVPLG